MEIPIYLCLDSNQQRVQAPNKHKSFTNLKNFFMEFIGKITAIGDIREGVSAKGAWKMRTFVIEDTNLEFPQSVLVTAKGDLVDSLETLLKTQQPGQQELIAGVYKARLTCRVRRFTKQDGSTALVNDIYCKQMERL